MAEAGILTRLAHCLQPRGGSSRLVIAAMLVLASMPAVSAMQPSALDQLPPVERYRQLNLILMVSEGIDPAFLPRLLSQKNDPGIANSTVNTFPLIDVEAFQTPLNRIVEQDALISRAALVFRFAQNNHADILESLESLAASDPEAAAQVDLIQLAEDAIIVRLAITGSLEYLESQGSDAAIGGYLDTYRNRTLYLRNVMEFWEFEQELAAITEDAIIDTGGRMDAYERMLEDEPDLDAFKQHLQAVEHIYWQTRNRKGKPPVVPSDELIEEESQVH
jgi:hypothetical protein